MNSDERGQKSSKQVEESRRKFLEKAGKLAIYTPPVLTLMMNPSRHALARSPGCNNGVGNGSDCLPPGIDQNGKLYLDNDDVNGTPGNPQNQGGFK